MTYEQIIKDLNARKFSPIYFLSGEEPYFIDKISEKIISTVLTEEEKEFNQSILYGLESAPDLIDAESRRYPMMSEYNLVVVREAQLVKNIEELQRYIDNPISSTILVICYKKKPDKRKKFFKSIEKKGVLFDSKKLYDNQIPDWIMKQIGLAGYHISVRNATLITEFLGNDLAHISNELGKIILNIPAGTTITGELIEEFIGINKEYNSFELNNALGHKNVVKANRIINYFGQNEKKYPMPLIMANLYSFFSKTLKLHYVSSSDTNTIASFIGVNRFFLKDYHLAARHYDRKKLVEIIGILHEYDLKSKGIGNSSVPERELMKELVYKIMH